jgi:hypothetical protein
MEIGASRIACGLAAGILAVAFAAVPLGSADARVYAGGVHRAGTPWVQGRGVGVNRGWHGNYGRYGRYGAYGRYGGYGRYGYPVAGGLAAGALLAAPYAYRNGGYYGDAAYGDEYYRGTNCRTEMVKHGNIHTRYEVQETVCD